MRGRIGVRNLLLLFSPCRYLFLSFLPYTLTPISVPLLPYFVILLPPTILLTAHAVDAAPPTSKYQKGTPGAGKDAVHLLRYKNDKSIRILEMEYRSMADTAAARIADYETWEW